MLEYGDERWRAAKAQRRQGALLAAGDALQRVARDAQRARDFDAGPLGPALLPAAAEAEAEAAVMTACLKSCNFLSDVVYTYGRRGR